MNATDVIEIRFTREALRLLIEVLNASARLAEWSVDEYEPGKATLRAVVVG
jgi:hypothetical protein